MWFKEEIKTTKLGDKRLNERLSQVLEALGNRPHASLPAALGGRNELEAAYRFFENEKVTPPKILKGHYDATLQRCQQQSVVCIAQDTTELDFTRPQQQVEKAGPLADASRLGAFLHLSTAFSEDGTPLGAIDAKLWARDMLDPNTPKLSRSEKAKNRRSLPIQEKESFRWLEGIRAAQKLAESCPNTTCISLSDSEGDIYELFAEPRTTDNFHWIVRACQDRIALDEQGQTVGTLRKLLQIQPVLYTSEIFIQSRKQLLSNETRARRQSRSSRFATVEVRAGCVHVQAPAANKHSLRSIPLNVIFVREVDPPADAVAIEWILLTTLSISTLALVRQIIYYYTVRWMIEVFFRTLKSGCRIEERRFETLDRMLACTAVFMIVAWRVLYVSRLGRSCPDLPCDLVFELSEWQSVWSVLHRGRPVPPKPPPLQEMVRLIASLGGYVNRARRKDPPGVETIWKGMQRMQDLAWAWQTFGPGADSS